MRLSIIFATLVLTTPAYAWTNTTNGHNNQIVDGGAGAQANQHQSSHAQSTTGPVSAVGGTASASVTVGAGSGYRQAPDVFVGPPGGGGMDCPTVGFGAGGAGLGGGGGIGPSWISSDCNKRKVTALLSQLYGPAVARAYAEKEIDGVKEAVDRAAQNTHPEYPYDWCYTRDAGNRRQRLACEGRK